MSTEFAEDFYNIDVSNTINNVMIKIYKSYNIIFSLFLNIQFYKSVSIVDIIYVYWRIY